MTAPLLTICILHYRKRVQLERTVTAIFANTRQPFRLRILNQGYEGDGIRTYLAQLERDERVDVDFLEENIGCSRGRQRVADAVNTRYTMMLDDDMCVSPGWDVPVLERFAGPNPPAVIGFRLFRTDGRFWCVGGWRIRQRGRVVRFSRPVVPAAMHAAGFLPVDGVCGGAMVFRTGSKDGLAWDPAYFIGFEDLDHAMRLKRAGARCEISLHSRFVHDKLSLDSKAVAYNAVRRDYRAIRASYLHFAKTHDCRLDVARDLFYRYACLLPAPVLRPFVFAWLHSQNVA